MQDYLNTGGRVFASHWHNYWLEKGPQPFPTVATFNHQADLANPFTADIDTSFPKGQALAEWLVNVGGKSPMGKIAINAAQHTVDAANAMVAQRWIYSTMPTSVQYLTANTPMNVPEDKQCGRVVLSDIHVSSGDTSTTSTALPGRLQDDRPVRPGKGARVHALRPLLVRHRRQEAPGSPHHHQNQPYWQTPLLRGGHAC